MQTINTNKMQTTIQHTEFKIFQAKNGRNGDDDDDHGHVNRLKNAWYLRFASDAVTSTYTHIHTNAKHCQHHLRRKEKYFGQSSSQRFH